jgi:hypothetical protein
MIARVVVGIVGATLALGTAAQATPGVLHSVGAGRAIIAVADVSPTHQQYIDDAKRDMQQWEARMRQWNADAKMHGTQISADAQRDLDKSWAALKTDWRHLQSAGDDAWDKARASFDRASQKMKTSWQSATSSS